MIMVTLRASLTRMSLCNEDAQLFCGQIMGTPMYVAKRASAQLRDLHD